MIQKLLPLSLAMILLCGCTTVRATSPARTAAEELLISTAADRAAEKLAQSVPVGLTAYFDGQYIAGTDAPYAAATMRDQLLRHGINLIDDKSKAEAVITPRMGALASNEISTVLGLPGLPVPSLLMPGASLTTPELNLFKQEETDGLAKFAATVTDTKTGKLIVATDPAYGYSRRSSWVLLFFITWHESDLGKGEKNPDYRILP